MLHALLCLFCKKIKNKAAFGVKFYDWGRSLRSCSASRNVSFHHSIALTSLCLNKYELLFPPLVTSLTLLRTRTPFCSACWELELNATVPRRLLHPASAKYSKVNETKSSLNQRGCHLKYFDFFFSLIWKKIHKKQGCNKNNENKDRYHGCINRRES